MAQLRYFILEREYRGIGLGGRVMELYMEHFWRGGYRASFLWTTHELAAAAHLYQRHGFVRTEEKASDAFGKSLYEVKYELI
jgi:peptidyl-dipeptidase Dcp